MAVVDFLKTLDKSPFSLLPPYHVRFEASRVGAGLVNLGNTCFLNAVLQCLTHTVPVVESLRSCYDHPSGGDFCLICLLRKHVDLSLALSGKIISPLTFVQNLSYFSTSFESYQQEDAHEFFQCLLDKLSSCVGSSLQDKPSCLQNDSFVNQIFGGRLRSRVQCCKCGHCSDTFEPLIDLSLEIEGVDTLDTALNSFTQVEKIGDSDTMFNCGNCKEAVSAEKQLTIDQAPAVAVLHLKRFKSNGLYVEKINEFVKYPLELDLHSFLSNPSGDGNEKLKYDLYAVLVHDGISSDSGHYFCFIRSSPDSWHLLNDSEVIRVNEDSVLNQNAYILFYKRQGSPWFSSLMETQKAYMDVSDTFISPTSVLNIRRRVDVSSSSSDSSSDSNFDEAKDSPSTSHPESSNSGIFLNVPSVRTGEAHYQIPRVRSSQEVWKKHTNNVLVDRRAKHSFTRLLKAMPSSRSCERKYFVSQIKRRRLS